MGFAASTEAIEVMFQPLAGCYEHLLEIYWKHSMQGVFVFSDEQERLAQESKEKHPGRDMLIARSGEFTAAGHAHQKYILQRNPDVYRALALSSTELIKSRVATRLNGYVAGFGNATQLDKEWRSFDIADEKVYRRVRQLCGRRR